MLPDESPMTASEVQERLAKAKGNKVMHYNTLVKAIRNHGLPARPNPFGRGFTFYWSEIQAWLQAPPCQAFPARRGPGRPRKVLA